MHKLNWRRDIPDIRDYKYNSHHTFKVAPLPPSMDLRPQMSPVFDQGQIGSCTSQALAGALEFLELRDLQNKVASAEIIESQKFDNFSRLFIYYNERLIEGDVDQDGGAQIRDGIKSLAQYGDCPETSWGYGENLLFQKPTEQSYMEALAHRITSYSRLDNTNIYELKHALASGLPIVFGFTVYSGFESPTVASTGILNLPTPQEGVEGGHAVLMVGYNDAEQMFLVRNSWGSNWGLQGYFKMPYLYSTNVDLASDFWVITR